MGTIVNLLPGTTHTFLGDTGTWEITSAGGHTIDDTREQIRFDNLGSLKITAGSTNPIVLTHDRVALGDQWDWESRAFYWVYSNEPLVATVGVTVYNSTTESASATIAVRARKWTLVSVEGAVPEESARIQMSVQISGLPTSEVAYLTNPTIVTPNAISRNLFAAECWMRLPQYLRDVDEEQTDPDYPALRFLDVITVDQDEIYTIWNDARYIPPDSDGGPKVSSFDPTIADLATLRWWAQLLGVQFYDPSSGTTSWINLETGVDVDGDGPEWAEWETVPDGGDPDSVASWEEIETFAPGVSGLEELIRWQVETAYFGLRGGTLESVTESAKKVLNGTKYTNFLQSRSTLNLPGSSGANLVTADKNSLDLTGDITLIVWASAVDWTPAANAGLLSKTPGSIVSGYGAYVQPSGVLSFFIGTGATTRVMASTAHGLIDGLGYWLEFFYDNTAKTCRFRKSFSSPYTPLDQIVWTTISTSAAHAGGSPAANTDQLCVGSLNTASQWNGQMSFLRLINGTPTVGTVVAEPPLSTQVPGTTSFTDGYGNTWTRGGTTSFVASSFQPEWVIHLQTKQSETPDLPDIGEASPTIEEIVAGAVPAGFEFIHETIPG